MNKSIAAVSALALILQGSLFSFPLVFVFLQILAIKKKGEYLFPLAFALGILLDSLYFKNLGTTSLFLVIFLFSVFAYERKFEIDNLTFIFISSFLGSMVLFILLGEGGVILKSLITSIFASILSILWSR